ncbi:uncharacterized protein MONOS_7472 [Monocercomonoides exilis]|uniref:uncharacterized protein n=1 Tax=Monocercomonoides exilis TaxID=2049356 RepID=UPI003559DB25|nr:hypothetical protein MONOS_7472 [Monocercomonoides exilis]|eukprot:MONOS_7472.1-p1 / transcript=MONOS_7472.1 / gene=MONOS_7472 / organism=Monocercomonoides_exilis_PA203 / gene_product=unspecified product / transcript_product=unspecified product / location=Mono_scaffold00256:15673-19420(-) / protein_length=896 / sequence_SO=supercontig / SO=protein_coding / is_pseudo=false
MLLSKKVLTIQHESAVEVLEQTLNSNRSVNCVVYSLNSSGSPLGMSAYIMQNICKAFENCRFVTQLKISHVPLTLLEIQQMSSLFCPKSKLNALSLSDCSLDDDSIMALLILILENKFRNLRYLDLSGNQLGIYTSNPPTVQYDFTPGCKVLSRLLIDKKTKLGTIILDRNPLGNYGLLCLCQVLPHSSLRELRISGINATTKGIFCLTRILKFCSSLNALDISHNYIGHSAMISLLNVLSSSQIKSLNISNTFLDDLSLIALGIVISKTDFIVSLDISQNKVSKNSAEVFCEFLLTNTSIETLICTEMGEDALEVFIPQALDAKYGRGMKSSREIVCLKHESVGKFSALKYKAFHGYIVTGLLFLVGQLLFSLISTGMSVMSSIEYIYHGQTVPGWLLAGFVMLGLFCAALDHFAISRTKQHKEPWMSLLYLLVVGYVVDTVRLIMRTKGNWDTIAEPVGKKDAVHQSTFASIKVIRALVESIPTIVVQGYMLLIAQQNISFINVLSFIASILSLTFVIASFLSTISTTHVSQTEPMEESFFWMARLFVYCLISLTLNLLRLCLAASNAPVNVVLYLVISFSFWFLVFSLMSKTTHTTFYIQTLLHILLLTPFGMGFYSDSIMSSAKGRSYFWLFIRRIPRFVFVLVDLLAFAFRAFTLLLSIVARYEVSLGFLFLVLILIFLDFVMILFRIVLEKNGSSSAPELHSAARKSKKKPKRGITLNLNTGELDGVPLLRSQKYKKSGSSSKRKGGSCESDYEGDGSNREGRGEEEDSNNDDEWEDGSSESDDEDDDDEDDEDDLLEESTSSPGFDEFSSDTESDTDSEPFDVIEERRKMVAQIPIPSILKEITIIRKKKHVQEKPKQSYDKSYIVAEPQDSLLSQMDEMINSSSQKPA